MARIVKRAPLSHSVDDGNIYGNFESREMRPSLARANYFLDIAVIDTVSRDYEFTRIYAIPHCRRVQHGARHAKTHRSFLILFHK